MIIRKIEPIHLRIPFHDGGSGTGLFPSAWTHLDLVLIRIEADNGLVGWGEGFGYSCGAAVVAMVNDALRPLLIDRPVDDPAAICDELQRRTILPGRYGITTFAISGVDIALWDLYAKSQSVSLANLLGQPIRDTIRAYASLVRYGQSDLVVQIAEQALGEGYTEIKLHEITLPEIRACRDAIGPSIPITVDVNCGWTESFAREVIPDLISLGTRWLEEPIFPPEDFRALASLQATAGIAIAAGENACTSIPFAEMLRLGAVEYLQPSVTKVGGVTEFQRVCSLCRQAGATMAPHSPYFGPGYLATLQFAAVEPNFSIFEYLYIEPEAWLYQEMPLPQGGQISIPTGPGLGFDPDPDTIARYRVTS